MSELAIIKDSIHKHAERLDDHETWLNCYEKSLQFHSKQVDDILSKTVPNLERKFTELNEMMCFKYLDLETHRRKWSLVLNGLQNEGNESENMTRMKFRQFAKEKLKINDVESHLLAACHRLSPEENSAITVRFIALDDRNLWLKSAKNLKSSDLKVSISPDLPPALRDLKEDILTQRKWLSLEDKQKSSIKYHKTWPYVTLALKDRTRLTPRISKEAIVDKFLGTQVKLIGTQ